MTERLLGKVMFLIGRGESTRRALLRLVESALRAGVAAIQLREKHLPLGEVVSEAEMLRDLTHSYGGCFVVNDRVDVALAVEADGVHLGREDMPIAVARGLMGAKAIVGATCAGVSEARRAERDGASYVSAGPVFASPTKPELGATGLQRVRRFVRAVSIPVCGIGGITPETAEAVIRAGADFIAVSSAISAAADPRAAAAALAERTAEAYALRP